MIPCLSISSRLPAVAALLLVLALAAAGCRGTRNATAPEERLIVGGYVMLPDSSAVADAFVRTEPASENIATNAEGRFQFTRLPGPGEYTFIATHPDPEYQNLEGRTTTVVEYSPNARMVYIIIGKTQRMDLLETGQQALPARSRGKKRTGTR